MIGACMVPTPSTTVPRLAWSVGTSAAVDHCRPGITKHPPIAKVNPPTIAAVLSLSPVDLSIDIDFQLKLWNKLLNLSKNLF
jgi:hypothetical protein